MPISIGVISNQFERGDLPLVQFVRDAVASDHDIEVVSHGYNHEDFSSFSLSDQIGLLRNSSDQIFQKLGTRPNVFIPPFNLIDVNTAPAAIQAGFTHISSDIDLDLPPYNFHNPPIWHFPEGAATSSFAGIKLYCTGGMSL